MAMLNISATIDSGLLEKLNELSATSERNRSWLITKALESYLEELEDMQTAKDRLNEPRLTPSKLRKELNAA